MGAEPLRPIGLVAGAGRFPITVAEKARSVGQPVVCVGIRHLADPVLQKLTDRFYWAGLGKMGRAIRCLRREGVRSWVMAGKVHKTAVLSPDRWLSLLPDWRTIRFWFSRLRRDNRDDSLLLGVIGVF